MEKQQEFRTQLRRAVVALYRAADRLERAARREIAREEVARLRTESAAEIYRVDKQQRTNERASAYRV